MDSRLGTKVVGSKFISLLSLLLTPTSFISSGQAVYHLLLTYRIVFRSKFLVIRLFHSDRRLATGFINAARIAW